MTIMLGKLYAALKAAGTPEQDAQAAAQEVGELREESTVLTNSLNELTREVRRVGAGLDDLRTDVAGLRSEFHYMRGRFDVLLWAVGINAAATIAILGVLLHR